MVRLSEIPRTACFSWSTGSGLPLLASGTKAGAVSADFSSESKLELWDLDLANPARTSEPTPTASVNTESRFWDLGWSKGNASHPKGVIAGGLDNGSLHLWDAGSLLEGSSDSLIATTQNHTAALKTLQFNPFEPDLLATGGAKGELYITNLKNVDAPTRLGNPAASRTDDLDTLDFNKCVKHILGTAGSNGFVTVWDLRTKKESLSLNNLNRKPISAIAWDPKVQYRLITAIPDDNHPLVLSWDLRNANAPLKQLQGHEGGVLSLSWCQQDETLLLSSGKDNRTICWNPHTGEQLGQLPAVTNWVFQTRWNPHFPNLLATASFDGRLTVQSIQSSEVTAPATQAQPSDTEDFFGQAQAIPPGSGLTLQKPPRWIERSCGVSFGFGGKLVSFTTAAASRVSKVKITTVQPDSSVGPRSKAFEETLEQGDLPAICDAHVAKAQTEQEKADWQVLKTLTESDPRQSLVNHLGFATATDEAADGLGALSVSDTKDEDSLFSDEAAAATNGTGSRSNRLSTFFGASNDGETFLADLASTKGAKTNEPFSLFSGNESESDRRITHALVLGQFEKALDICLQEGRMSDAFMVAICGGAECTEKAKKAYFSQKTGGPNYLRLLASVVGKNLWDVVYNAGLENWAEVMAALCTFADGADFPDLCEALGDRLMEDSRVDAKKSTARKDASLCYLTGGKVERISKIWIEELKENEAIQSSSQADDSSFSIHATLLQGFIEKITVFREATDYVDEDLSAPSGWRLTHLYEKYSEFANIATAHGQMDVAKRYLDLLPASFPAAILSRSRVEQATNPISRQARTTMSMNPSVTPPKPAGYGIMGRSRQDSAPGQPYPGYSSGLNASTASRGIAPVNAQPGYGQANGGFRPAQSLAGNPYQPPQMSQYSGQQFQQYGQTPTNNGYGQQAGIGRPPPQRGMSASPVIPPPSKNKNLEAWNDTPYVAKAPTPRRGTPSIPQEVTTNPYMFQPSTQVSPSMPPPSAKASAPPPPPKGNAAPPRPIQSTQPKLPPPGQQSERPSSRQYTPTQAEPPSLFAATPPVPRGPSPYNAPPGGSVPSNRYAPVAQPTQQGTGPPAQPQYGMSRPRLGQQPPSMGTLSMQPPPPSFGGPTPPSNRYGPPPSSQAPTGSVGPPPRSGPGAPPPISRPGTAASGASHGSNASAAIYPKGDRSHIPVGAQPIVDILSGVMDRVAAQAPESHAKHVSDTQKRLDLLYDHLNRGDLLAPDTVQQMVQLARDLQQGNYAEAQALQMSIQTQKANECGMWMVGIKRLCAMAKGLSA